MSQPQSNQHPHITIVMTKQKDYIVHKINKKSSVKVSHLSFYCALKSQALTLNRGSFYGKRTLHANTYNGNKDS